MSLQGSVLRNLPTDKARGAGVAEKGRSFLERAAKVAAVASSEANDVDRTARFHKAAIEKAREQALLAVQIPRDFGGCGASIVDVADMCYALGRACASTAMIFAMHQTK